MASTIPCTADGPVTNPPVSGVCPLADILASRARTGGLGSSANTDAKVAHQMLVETVGLVGSQNPPSIDHRPTMGLVLPNVLSAVTKVGRSGVVVAQSTVASAPDVATLPATAAAVPSNEVNEFCDTMVPPSLTKAVEKSWHAVTKYASNLSVTTVAVFQPCAMRSRASTAPSDWGALPKLNANLPAGPKREGPIWFVPMHGATVSTLAARPTWTAGVA